MEFIETLNLEPAYGRACVETDVRRFRYVLKRSNVINYCGWAMEFMKHCAIVVG